MRKRGIAQAVALLLVVSMGWFSAGCFGKFQLTRKVYDINQTSVDDPYVRSALTWVLVIVPVYAFAGFLDFVLFNVIEFWSGENPLASGPTSKAYPMGEDSVRMTIAREDGATVARIDRFRGGKLVATLRVRDTGDSVNASVTEGGVETTRIAATRLPDGSVQMGNERVSPAVLETYLARVARIGQAVRAGGTGAAPLAPLARVPAMAG